jgi:hypothetical protein
MIYQGIPSHVAIDYSDDTLLSPSAISSHTEEANIVK